MAFTKLCMVMLIIFLITMLGCEKREDFGSQLKPKIGPISKPTSQPVQPKANQNPGLISSCKDIQESGFYILDKDVSSNDDICIKIQNRDGVHIDCKGHLINSNSEKEPSVRIINSNDFSLINCMVQSKYKNSVEIGMDDASANESGILTTKISKGKLEKNEFGPGAVSAFKTEKLEIINNKFYGHYSQHGSENNLINNNVFDLLYPETGTAGMILLSFGKNNEVSNNFINGKSDGIFRGSSPSTIESNIGADDGIVIAHESSDLIKDNTIENVFDCGIESEDFISDTKIINNKIRNAVLCGIGAWHGNSWLNNQVLENIVHDAPALFVFFKAGKVDVVYFKDNQFIGNKFIEPRTDSSRLTSFILDITKNQSSSFRFDISTKDSQFILENNLFQNNDFSKIINRPIIIPTHMVKDGGGNICKDNNIELDDDGNPIAYPLRCS